MLRTPYSSDAFRSTKWLKGHWTIFEKFLFNVIAFIMKKVIANLQIQQEKLKIYLGKWRNHQFLLNMHKVGIRLICII